MLDDLLKQICVDEANIEYFIEVGEAFPAQVFLCLYLCICICVCICVEG